MMLGAGFGWLGATVGYRAIDPEAYRDSPASTYLVFGGGCLAIAATLVVAGVGVLLQLLKHWAPRWPAALLLLFGLVPYAVFLGTPAVVVNVCLLVLAAVLFASRRLTRTEASL